MFFKNWICWYPIYGRCTLNQYSIAVGKDFPANRECTAYGFGVYPIKIQSDVQPGDVFRFCVNFKDGTVTVFQNDQQCGIMCDNVDEI